MVGCNDKVRVVAVQVSAEVLSSWGAASSDSGVLGGLDTWMSVAEIILQASVTLHTAVVSQNAMAQHLRTDSSLQPKSCVSQV